jgi:hypothetical protein
MNEIYDKKANKYKYKYLKLKNEYFGEGGTMGSMMGGMMGDKVTRYAIQGTQKNKWFNSNYLLFTFISLNNIKINEDEVSIATYNNIKWIYIIKNQTKYIINLDTKIKYQIYELKLPIHEKQQKIDVSELKQIITDNNINIEYDINNNDNDNDNLYYTEGVFEWIASENWQKNILSMFFNNQQYNSNQNLISLYLQKNMNSYNNNYLFFKYKDINYISYILNINTESTESTESTEFIILNLETGEKTRIFYAKLIEHDGIEKIDDNEQNYYLEKIQGKKIPDLENDEEIKEIQDKNSYMKIEKEEKAKKAKAEAERVEEIKKENSNVKPPPVPRKDVDHERIKRKLLTNISNPDETDEEIGRECRELLTNYTNICSKPDDEKNKIRRKIFKENHTDRSLSCKETRDIILKDFQEAYKTCPPQQNS